MTSDAIKDGTKRSSAGEKMANSDKAAREIMAKEKAQRDSKSDRLREARLAQEAERAANPVGKPPRKASKS